MKLDKELHIRLTSAMLEEIRLSLEHVTGIMSKNTWILHAIAEKLEREKK